MDNNSVSFSIKAANYSWQLAIFAVILAVLSKQVKGALVLIEIISLIAIVLGVIFGIIGLSGIFRNKSKKALFPSLVGLIINGLLLLIFMNNFMAAYTSSTNVAKPQVLVETKAKHIGTWEAQNPKDQKIRWVISDDEFEMSYYDMLPISGSYMIDYSKTPIWLDVVVKGQDGAEMEMPLIIEFAGPDTMKALGPSGDSIERPAGFEEGGEAVLIFKRIN